MIEVTQLNGTRFVLNCDLIETIEYIPETKVTLTSGRYFLVREKQEEIIRKVIAFRRLILKNGSGGNSHRPNHSTKTQGESAAHSVDRRK